MPPDGPSVIVVDTSSSEPTPPPEPTEPSNQPTIEMTIGETKAKCEALEAKATEQQEAIAALTLQSQQAAEATTLALQQAAEAKAEAAMLAELLVEQYAEDEVDLAGAEGDVEPPTPSTPNNDPAPRQPRSGVLALLLGR